MEKQLLTMYLENITCIKNLEGAVELSSDCLRALVTLESPVKCKYFLSICKLGSTVIL